MVRFLCVLAVFLFAGGMALRGAKATGLSAVATLGANSLRAPTMPTSLAQVRISKINPYFYRCFSWAHHSVIRI